MTNLKDFPALHWSEIKENLQKSPKQQKSITFGKKYYFWSFEAFSGPALARNKRFGKQKNLSSWKSYYQM